MTFKLVIILLIIVSYLLLQTNLLKPDNYMTYYGYKIYDIFANNDAKQAVLYKYFLETNFDILTPSHSSDEPIRVLVSPQQERSINSFLKAYAINFTIPNDNIFFYINELHSKSKKQSHQIQSIDFTQYLRYSEINNYLDYLADQYPTQVVVETVGKSYEGRDLKTILIKNIADKTSSNAKKLLKKPLILIDAGMHAREWISPASALYIIQQLTENATFYQTELQAFDWLIWPLVNPDGYEYSHIKKRFWRKTRRPIDNNTLHDCVGADGNRNFEFQWGGMGTSDNVCSDVYKGTEPFSEPEVRALRDLMLNVSESCRMYISLHSYGNYILYPWGYDNTLVPSWQNFDIIAKAGADAIKLATGTRYKVGGTGQLLYPAAGGSDDFAYAVANIPLAFTIELTGGGTGFDPPESSIKSIVAECLIGIKAMAAKIVEVGNEDKKNSANGLFKNAFWNFLF